jgi:hypothetical protein
MRKYLCILCLVAAQASAQTFTQYTTTEQLPWQTKGKVSLSTKAKMQQTLNSKLPTQNSKAFKAWGTCFNELDLDAIRLLKPEEQEKIMHDIGKRVVICGNTNNEARELSIPVGNRYLTATLAAHSFNTFVEK